MWFFIHVLRQKTADPDIYHFSAWLWECCQVYQSKIGYFIQLFGFKETSSILIYLVYYWRAFIHKCLHILQLQYLFPIIFQPSHTALRVLHIRIGKKRAYILEHLPCISIITILNTLIDSDHNNHPRLYLIISLGWFRWSLIISKKCKTITKFIE